jgi:glycosyltransferase involved in cell wall biosynthesis
VTRTPGGSLRVALVCVSDVYGGAEIYIQRVSDALQERGHRVLLVGRVHGYSGDQIDPGFGPKWTRRHALTGIVRVPAERVRLSRALAAFGPDIVHMQFKREQVAFTRPASRWAPVVWTEHGRLDDRTLPGPLRALYARSASRIEAVTVVSRAIAEDLRGVTPAPRIEVIENAADVARLRVADAPGRAAARSRLGIAAGAPVLAWVGRMHPAKRPELAVAIGRSGPATVLMAGAGPILDEVRRLAAGSQRVRVLGHLDDVSDVLHAADAFLFTSGIEAREGVPTTSMLEAASAGLPIVASRESGDPSSVQEAGGVLVAPGAAIAEWVAAVDHAVGEPDRRERARRWAEEHSLASWSGKIDDFFRSAAHIRA